MSTIPVNNIAKSTIANNTVAVSIVAMSTIPVKSIAQSIIAPSTVAHSTIAVYCVVAGTALQKDPCQTSHTTLTEAADKAIKQGQKTALADCLAICLDKTFQADMLNQETFSDLMTLQTIARRAEEEENDSQNPWTWSGL